MDTAKEHLAWCVERALEYANTGDMVNAWASFGSDCTKHPGTAHIPDHLLYGMEMVRQVGQGCGPEQFREFVSGWNV